MVMSISVQETRRSAPQIPEQLLEVAERFAAPGRVADVQPHGSGNVHETFLVLRGGRDEAPFILQRLNTHVFRRPELVMQNMHTVTEHMLGRIHRIGLPAGRRWEVLRLLSTEEGKELWFDADGRCWRALSFIPAAQPFGTIRDGGDAEEVGYALGLFHRLISDLPAQNLADTLEGFHVTPRYLARYDAFLGRSHRHRSPEKAYALAFVNERRAFAPVLEAARTQGTLVVRPIHGDPKMNNIMIDPATRRAVSVIDLDTVKPGLVQYDIGDCLRSCCNPLGEETERWEEVRFEPDLCRPILRGYLTWARSFLTPADCDFLFAAVRLIAFELGLRFLTDHLEGNVYFKVRHREHNLARALVQFRLTESIEAQEGAIRAIIQDLL